ncbi:MAG: hydrogenase-4 component E [Magnetococcales bacterium]|nr:hydrogenase-4 component E [Magnetococcales bacterium]
MAYGYDISHLLSASVLVFSFLLLFQGRMFGLLNMFVMQAVCLSLTVASQAHFQNAPHLYVTAAIALFFKAGIIPYSLRRIIIRLGIYRDIETIFGVGLTLVVGVALTCLAIMTVMPLAHAQELSAREDLAFALSVILMGMLMMITRKNAISQIVGFMSLENGLVLAATGVRGMPLVVEFSVAFSILIAFFVFGLFVFRIRESFDSVEIHVMEQYRGEKQ